MITNKTEKSKGWDAHFLQFTLLSCKRKQLFLSLSLICHATLQTLWLLVKKMGSNAIKMLPDTPDGLLPRAISKDTHENVRVCLQHCVCLKWLYLVSKRIFSHCRILILEVSCQNKNTSSHSRKGLILFFYDPTSSNFPSIKMHCHLQQDGLVFECGLTRIKQASEINGEKSRILVLHAVNICLQSCSESPHRQACQKIVITIAWL